MKKMKKTFMQCLMLLMVAMASMTTLSSCHKDDEVAAPQPTPQPAKPTTYTIMLYGCGGGNLDNCLDYNLSQLDAHGKTDRVNFTGLIKFSKPRQNESTTEGTRLFTLTSEGMKNEKVHEASYRLDNPANLTQFIKDSKEKMPADKYILIFWNHGQEFGLNDQLPENKDYQETTKSRSILFDDNTGNTSLSVYDIEKGIKDSGTKLDLIYMDLCNYGMAEVYYQLKDCAHYMMAATAPTADVGGNYAELLEDLQNNDSLTDAIKEYVPNCVRSWKNINDGNIQEDLECYDLSYMDELAGYMKGAMSEYSSLMKKAAEKQQSYDKVYQGTVLYDYYGKYSGLTDQLFIFDAQKYSVDVCSAFNRIAGNCLNGVMSYNATMMQRTLDKMRVAQAANNLPAWMDGVSMGIMWPTNSFINKKAVKNNNINNNLGYAALYKVTGWGDFLSSTTFPLSKADVSPLEGNTIYLNSEYSYKYLYPWQYEITVDKSGLDEKTQEKIDFLIDTYTTELNSSIEKRNFSLCLGMYAIKEAINSLYYNNEKLSFMNQLLANKVETFKIKIHTTEPVKNLDSFKDQFPAEAEQEVNVREYIQNRKNSAN